jgi:RNA polymerase sigma-70 factor (sigma-E family)
LYEVMTSPGYDERFDELAAIAYRVAFRVVGSREDARELAQEAMARAYAHWRRASTHPEAWVARVASNLAIDLLRRRGRPIEAPPEPMPDLGVHVAERMELVQALRRLPRRQRQVVVLRYLADLPERHVAEQLGCTTGTVKQHASRGLAALRAALDEPLPIPVPMEER